MKNTVPPPVYLVLAGALMWLVSRSQYDPSVSVPLAKELSIACFIAGALIAIVAVLQFRKAQTTIDPLHPGKASALVSKGIFRFSRNPMYLGMAFLLLNLALKLESAFALMVLPLFILVITYAQIKPEEVALTSLFGTTYTDYCQRVRRWI
jgi:protein-S-isoprenylcysteine O-methyltransferase Ste14